jgi:hypothetical protein
MGFNFYNALEQMMDPRIAVTVFLAFLIGYYVFLDEESQLGENGFFAFGPSNNVVFMGIAVNTWGKCITLYAISFFTALMTGYYEAALGNNFMMKLVDADVSMPWSQPTVFGLVSIDKVIGMLLEIIEVLIITSQQFQFMIPALVGDLAIGVLDAAFLLNQKNA